MPLGPVTVEGSSGRAGLTVAVAERSGSPYQEQGAGGQEQIHLEPACQPFAQEMNLAIDARDFTLFL